MMLVFVVVVLAVLVRRLAVLVLVLAVRARVVLVLVVLVNLVPVHIVLPVVLWAAIFLVAVALAAILLPSLLIAVPSIQCLHRPQTFLGLTEDMMLELPGQAFELILDVSSSRHTKHIRHILKGCDLGRGGHKEPYLQSVSGYVNPRCRTTYEYKSKCVQTTATDQRILHRISSG
jgi:hypothetical protein